MPPTDQQEDQGTRQSEQDFLSQIDAGSLGYIPNGNGIDSTMLWTQAYFDSAEQQLRTARRVSEVAALTGIRQQIEDNAVARVLHRVQQQQRSQPKQASSSGGR